MSERTSGGDAHEQDPPTGVNSIGQWSESGGAAPGNSPTASTSTGEGGDEATLDDEDADRDDAL